MFQSNEDVADPAQTRLRRSSASTSVFPSQWKQLLGGLPPRAKTAAIWPTPIARCLSMPLSAWVNYENKRPPLRDEIA